jgi:hypothetical protein
MSAALLSVSNVLARTACAGGLPPSLWDINDLKIATEIEALRMRARRFWIAIELGMHRLSISKSRLSGTSHFHP